MRALLLGVLFALAALAAAAQTPVLTIPQPAYNNNLSGTITSTNVFQQVLAQGALTRAQRQSGWIQNQDTNPMWVWFGGPNDTSCAAAGVTKGSAVMLSPGSATAPGGTITFNTGGIVDSGLVCITGTSTGVFSGGFN